MRIYLRPLLSYPLSPITYYLLPLFIACSHIVLYKVMSEKEKDPVDRRIPLTFLKGVGPVIAKGMEKKGIRCVDDLLYFVPVRWLDRGTVRNISELEAGEDACVVAAVDSYRSMFFRHARKKGFEVIVTDGTGFLSLKWFQWSKGYLQKICRKGETLFLSGKVGDFGGNLQMVHPETAVLGDDGTPGAARRIIPVYSQVDGVKQGFIRNVVSEALNFLGSSPGGVLPRDAEERFGLMSFADAAKCVHVANTEEFSEDRRNEALRRLILEEYLHFQITLMSRKKKARSERGIAFATDGPLYRKFLGNLGFKLTGAQSRAMMEIISDMGRDIPMNRLLQGDVGSGKTVCAVACACVAIDNGFQAAFMAPTEILAEQHYLNVHRWFAELGVPVALLKGGMGRERRDVIEGIRTGVTPIVIGTHAMIQGDVEFHRLGLVVIDEQHRFGVEQRKRLKDKSRRPDVLSMTATPIPRTLSMVVYGDLDVSVINEMPSGRQKVVTKVLSDDDRERAQGMMREELAAGRGIFVVYPLVEESENNPVRDAKSMAAELQRAVFLEYRVGLLHGRMSAKDKEDVMTRFRNGDIDVLVCTTVIEVGIDVPRATMIVVENAERFGLSQLHQLRGRVGRGTEPSRCVLIASTKRTHLATRRLRIMEKTSDGFAIAEEDLKIRGVGDMLGVRQSGMPAFRIGDIVRDIDIMVEARKRAEELTAGISEGEMTRLMRHIGDRFEDGRDLSDIA
jgi:ATP-dependent DNA helicase RecG